MRITPGRPSLVVAMAVPLLLLACDSSEPTASPPEVTATTDVQATISALARVEEIGTPTPTPVRPEDVAVVAEFVTGHDAVSREWDRFHSELDAWREALTECGAASFKVDLNGFAARFIVMGEGAGALPRLALVREMADLLVQATEKEGAAIRQLRDGWTPDSTAGFEAVDMERSASLTMTNGVRDLLEDLKDATSGSARLLLGGYSVKAGEMEVAWDRFHRNYDLFRAGQIDPATVGPASRLSELIEEFGVVLATIRELPQSKVTQPITTSLAETAEAEDLALRRLRSTAPLSEEVPFEQLDPTLVDAFEAQLVSSNAMRRQAGQALAQVVETASEENEAGVLAFEMRYSALASSLDRFHQDYDEWRRTEGGCDRSQAVADLGGFALQFGQIAGSVRGLPGATLLRPLRELLVEAAEEEHRALGELRNGWRPFDAAVYKGFDMQRSTTGKLRRQVAAGTQDLVARFGVSP